MFCLIFAVSPCSANVLQVPGAQSPRFDRGWFRLSALWCCDWPGVSGAYDCSSGHFLWFREAELRVNRGGSVRTGKPRHWVAGLPDGKAGAGGLGHSPSVALTASAAIGSPPTRYPAGAPPRSSRSCRRPDRRCVVRGCRSPLAGRRSLAAARRCSGDRGGTVRRLPAPDLG